MLAVVALAAGFAACGDDDEAQSVDPADVPRNAVALVGDQRVSKDELDRQVAAVRRAQRSGNEQTRDQLRQQALTNLIQQAILEQEAEREGVAVTGAEVRERLRQTRRQLHTAKARKSFFGNQTSADLRFQTRLQALTEKVEAAAREDGTDPAKFWPDLQERWASRTACRKGYVSGVCGDAAG